MRKEGKKIQKRLISIGQFLIFWMLAAFTVSCCMILFLSNAEVSETVIRERAPLVFGNIFVLSAVFAVSDTVRRFYTVNRPVKKILDATKKIRQGDFNVRIPVKSQLSRRNEFDIIAEDLNAMTEELAGIETLRTDFISNVSHELKTPLTVIQNYATMLQDPKLSDEDRVEYAKALHMASVRLVDLIQNILKLNKLENQKIFPDTARFNLSEQLCECLLNFESIWEEKELKIDTEIEMDVMVDADAELLRLVWNNLISNAVKFTEPGGTIRVSLHNNDSSCEVTVQDTGCGISLNAGKHIFDKFYQGDTSHAVQGNGLGLALVKRVIDIMNGEIGVESEVGKGSTFRVTLNRRGE